MIVNQKILTKVFANVLKFAAMGAVIGAGVGVASTAQAASISEQQVYDYANRIQSAANRQDIGAIARLIDEDAIVMVSRKGQSSLDKSGYLRLLQRSWQNTSNYHYAIEVNDVVLMGDEAKANITTTETFSKDGKPVRYVTQSRASFSLKNSNALLLRAVSQVTIN